MSRRSRRAERTLVARQADFDAMRPDNKRGRARPGSQNAHKNTRAKGKKR